jgi:putative acetyltransferase
MLSLRPIFLEDNFGVAALIRRVMPEFGAGGEGFAIHDAEVDEMFQAYSRPRSQYFVLVEEDGSVVGGGGIAPLAGGDPSVCELRKMYFLGEARGLGFGQKLMDLCLKSAREFGFHQCYLETLVSMEAAGKLYLKNGFRELNAPMGNTGHFSCDHWLVKNIGL